MRFFPTAVYAAFVGLSLSATPADAQTPIELTAGTFPATAAARERWQALAPAGLPLPGSGANRAWDYRPALRTGTVRQQVYAAAANPAFPAATRSLIVTLPLGQAPITARRFQQLTPQGLVELGLGISRQVFPVSATDSIVVLAQNILYAVPLRLQALPYTFGAPAATVAQRLAVRAELTVAAFNLRQAPMLLVQRLTRQDSVAGWGTVQVPVAGQPGSAAIPVLLRRLTVSQQDSLYLNGSPAPAPLLQGLQFPQGAYTATFRDVFLRLNTPQPVLTLTYADFSRRQLTGAEVSAEQSLPLGLLPADAAPAGLQGFPNPASAGRALHLTWAGYREGQPATLTVSALDGRLVARFPVVAGQAVALPASLSPGCYQLLLMAPAGGRPLGSTRLVVTE